MRGAGGQVEYVKIMQDFDGRSKVTSFSLSRHTAAARHPQKCTRHCRALVYVSLLASKMLRMLLNSWTTQICKVCQSQLTFLATHSLPCLPVAEHACITVCTGRQIGLRGDRDAEGDAGRDAARGGDRGGDRPSRRDDDDYRSSRRDDSYRSRRDDDRSQRRERSPRRDRDSYRDRGDDRQRRDDHRSDRAPRQKESRGGKTAEELDAEMDVYKEEVSHIQTFLASLLFQVMHILCRAWKTLSLQSKHESCCLTSAAHDSMDRIGDSSLRPCLVLTWCKVADIQGGKIHWAVANATLMICDCC